MQPSSRCHSGALAPVVITNASADKAITQIAFGYFLGAALMIAGGIVAAILGVHAEGESLESIAKPLTAHDDPPSEREEDMQPA